MKKLFTNFLKEEEGSIVEYVILIAVVAVIIAILFPILKGKMGDWFGDTMGNIDCGIGRADEVTHNLNQKIDYSDINVGETHAGNDCVL